MELKKLAFLDMNPHSSISEENKKTLEAAAPGAEYHYFGSFEELYERLPDADAVFFWPHTMKQDFIEYCRSNNRLKWLHSYISGDDAIMDTELWNMKHIRISNTRGIHGPPMADHLIAMIFYFLRRLDIAVRAQANRRWVGRKLASAADESIGKTVGFVGLGNIGLVMAEKCHKLGMRVLAAKRNPVDVEFVEKCYRITELHEMLGQCDFVVTILPLTDETRHIIGKAEFKAMKNTAVYLNLARGGVVDEAALIEALQSGEIAGAGLDVTTPEPLDKQSPLWDMPNVLITFHTAAQSPFYMDRACKVIAENIRRFIAGEPLLYESKR